MIRAGLPAGGRPALASPDWADAHNAAQSERLGLTPEVWHAPPPDAHERRRGARGRALPVREPMTTGEAREAVQRPKMRCLKG